MESNIAGFLGFLTYAQSVLIDATHYIKIAFDYTASLRAVLNDLPNPCKPMKVPMALYGRFQSVSSSAGHGRFLPDQKPFKPGQVN